MRFGQKLFQPKAFPDLPASVSAASPHVPTRTGNHIGADLRSVARAGSRRQPRLSIPRSRQITSCSPASPVPSKAAGSGGPPRAGGTASEAPGGRDFGTAGSVSAGCATKPVVPQTPGFYLTFLGKLVTESSSQELPGTWPLGARPSFRSMASGRAEEESHTALAAAELPAPTRTVGVFCRHG